MPILMASFNSIVNQLVQHISISHLFFWLYYLPSSFLSCFDLNVIVPTDFFAAAVSVSAPSLHFHFAPPCSMSSISKRVGIFARGNECVCACVCVLVWLRGWQEDERFCLCMYILYVLCIESML